MVNKNSKIYIAGHNGMVGSACWKELYQSGYHNLIGRSSKQLNLKNQEDVKKYLAEEKPDIVIDAAARVGGILANDQYPFDFLMDNLQIQANLIETSIQLNIPRFIFLGSSCIYPKFANQPIKESYLLDGFLEPTNQWYAIAKISGVKLIEAARKQFKKDYISLMPTNLYGPGDNFDLNSSHVIPALIRKFSDAKENNNSDVTLWGTGNPMREFLHVDDLAKAIRFSIENNLKYPIYNIGTGKDITIKNLASIIQEIVGHKGKIIWDNTKPDGTPRKLLDTTRVNSEGWSYSIELRSGLEKTYQWFLSNKEQIRKTSFIGLQD